MMMENYFFERVDKLRKKMKRPAILKLNNPVWNAHFQNLELSRSMDNTAGEVASLLNLGATCELLGRTKKAIEWYTLVSMFNCCQSCELCVLLKYLSLMVQLKDLCGQAKALATLASLSEDTGDMKKARIYYTKVGAVICEIHVRNFMCL